MLTRSNTAPLIILESILWGNMTVLTRLVHKNLFIEVLKMQGRFKLHFDGLTNVRKDVLLKYRSFIKLQGKIHGHMGRSCPNQVWAITLDWSALAT